MDIQLTSQQNNELSAEELAALRALLQAYPIHNHDGRNSLEVATDKIKKAIESYNIVVPTSAIAGENLSDGDAVKIGNDNDATINRIYVSNTSHTGYFRFRDFNESKYYRFAQSFRFAGNLSQRMYKVEILEWNHISPTYVDLCSDNNGKPGSVLTSSSSWTSGSNISLYGFYFYYWSVGFSYNLQPDTTYWLVFRRPSTSTSFILYSGNNPYSGGGMMRQEEDASGNPIGEWQNLENWDLWFNIYFAEIGGRIYKAHSQNNNAAVRYLGICNGNFSADSTPSIISKGIKSNYTNLTGGNVYYLTNTPGIISTSFSTGKTWQAATQYYAGDIVYYNGSFWVCRFNHTSGSSWDGSYWDYYIPKPVAIALDQKNLFIL